MTSSPPTTRLDSRRTRRRLPRIAAIAVVTIPLLLSVGLVVAASMADPPMLGPIRGVRLGHAPAQVRERFASEIPGHFRGAATGEDFALSWTPAQPASSEIASAELEFHTGMLVAMRLDLRGAAPEAVGAPLEVTDGSVLSRERGARFTRVTWLSRSCPTHEEEVRELIGDAR